MGSTLDMLMAKAEQRNDDKLKIKKVESKSLGEIVFKKPPLAKVSALIDEAESGLTTYDAIRNNAALIYEAWPLAKDNFAKLKEAYEVADPYDLVIKIFDSDISELQILAEKVLGFYGLGTVEAIKN